MDYQDLSSSVYNEDFSDSESVPPGHESIQAIGSSLRSAVTEAKASLDLSPEAATDSVSVVHAGGDERPLASLSALHKRKARARPKKTAHPAPKALLSL